MRIARSLSFFSVYVFCAGFLVAQSPPEITNATTDFNTAENERVRMLVDLSDPDPDEVLTLSFSLANGAELGITQSQLQFNFTSKSFAFSNVTVSNQFSVPSGTVGRTIEILVQVSDKDGLTASRMFRYHVVEINQPPFISLSVTQPGSSAAGTLEDPFSFGTLQYSLVIQDDFGVDDFTYGLQLVSGSFCINYPFQWFGREGLTPTVDVPPVATLTVLDASATVVDGIFVESVHRTIWVEPEPGGCDLGGGGPGPDPLDTVTATAFPNPVEKGEAISLLGSMSGDTTGYLAAWYLADTAGDQLILASPELQSNKPMVWTMASTTSGDQLIAYGWEAEYQAKGPASLLNFKFRVSEIDGIKEAVRTVTVEVLSPGGGGKQGPPPAGFGTMLCREVQLEAQGEVLSGGPYKNNSELVKVASQVVDPYRKNGDISNRCSSCILQPFKKRAPVEEQEACGWLCPCLDLPGWAALLGAEDWMECVTADPYWDPLVAIVSDSYLLWAGFQIDSPVDDGFNACVAIDLIDNQFLDLLAPITIDDRNECMGLIKNRAGELGLTCD